MYVLFDSKIEHEIEVVLGSSQASSYKIRKKGFKIIFSKLSVSQTNPIY